MRAIIRDCKGDIAGNPKGYKSIASASRELNKPSSKAYRTVWDRFFANACDSQDRSLVYTIAYEGDGIAQIKGVARQ